jgi:hypothetical protein
MHLHYLLTPGSSAEKSTSSALRTRPVSRLSQYSYMNARISTAAQRQLQSGHTNHPRSG